MPPDVCWFVQSHRDPEQILRLLRTLRRGSDGLIVLRHDHDVTPLDPAPFVAVGNVRLLPSSGRQQRGHFSGQLEPYLNLLDWLDSASVRFDWLINLTAQDYPVTPVPEIERFLGATHDDGYIRWWDVLKPGSPWSRRKARARYWYRYHLLPTGFERILRPLRWVTRLTPLHFYFDYGPSIGARVLNVPFRDGFRCLGGRSWWTLRRSATDFIREFARRNPAFVQHYRHVIAPEESFVQTVLVGSGRFNLVNDDFRYVDYTNAVKGSPRTLTVADLPMLVAGGYHFARKFDLGIDAEVVDRIDREILGQAPA